MGLSDNQKRLIKAVVQNDILSAKKIALACVREDTTNKNLGFTKKYESILSQPSMNMLELPMELKGLIAVEDVSNTFQSNRYYLSPRELSVFERILKMKKVNEKLMEMKINYLNSTLLYGESGTGKTTFGRYIAYKTGLPFCYLNFSCLVDSYMGNTSKNISKAFSYAINNPCIFMLDEIDCISIRRSSGNSGSSSGEMARITITLMQELDKLPNDVIVIAATNRKDRIDEALLRRFSVLHQVNSLNKNEMLTMVEKYFSNFPTISFSSNEINSIAENNINQAQATNTMIRLIADKLQK